MAYASAEVGRGKVVIRMAQSEASDEIGMGRTTFLRQACREVISAHSCGGSGRECLAKGARGVTTKVQVLAK